MGVSDRIVGGYNRAMLARACAARSGYRWLLVGLWIHGIVLWLWVVGCIYLSASSRGDVRRGETIQTSQGHAASSARAVPGAVSMERSDNGAARR